VGDILKCFIQWKCQSELFICVSFSEGKAWKERDTDHSPHIVPRSKMRRAIFLSSLTLAWRSGTALFDKISLLMISFRYLKFLYFFCGVPACADDKLIYNKKYVLNTNFGFSMHLVTY
jgi:hypothetical protein